MNFTETVSPNYLKTQQYVSVVLFVMLHKVVLLLSLWTKSSIVTIQMKATEQYFPVVLFIMLYNVVLAFESVDEILKCDHSNESFLAILFLDALYVSHFFSKWKFHKHPAPFSSVKFIL